MTTAGGESGRMAGDERDQFIPVRKGDVLDALIEHGPFANEAGRSDFRQICRMLAAVYHYEYFDRLEQLRHAYFYFNPELNAQTHFRPATIDKAYRELVDLFVGVLHGANFVEVSQEEIERAHRENVEVNVELRAPVEDFHEVRFFRRGHHDEDIIVPRWFGWRSKTINTSVYDDVVLFVALKPEEKAGDAQRRARKRRVRPGSVLIKYFHNIASSDLNALFPNVQVVMSLIDKIILAVPAILGGIPILWKLWSTMTVLLLVIGFYLGFSAAAVQEEHWAGALAAMAGLIALGGFVMRQFMKYQRQSLIYHKQLADNIYYRNVNNNAGIFDYIIGAAEDQECKEAFLAYYFLHTAASPLSQAALDRRIEAWLKDRFKLDIDFEVEDALGKLERLGLLIREGGRLSVLTPGRALARIDEVWDNYFQFSAGAKAALQA
jgi:hypothetical protein